MPTHPLAEVPDPCAVIEPTALERYLAPVLEANKPKVTLEECVNRAAARMRCAECGKCHLNEGRFCSRLCQGVNEQRARR